MNGTPTLAHPIQPVSQTYGASIVSPAVRIAPQVEVWRTMQVWVPQMADHVTFAALGIEDPALRTMAENIQPDWEKLRTDVANGSVIQESQDEMVATARTMLIQLRAYKTQLIETSASKWIGWLYPSFLVHIRDELDFFVRSLDALQGVQSMTTMTKAEQLCFFVKMSMEHLGFASGLVDPNLEPMLHVNLLNQQGLVGRAYQAACSPLGAAMQHMSNQLSPALDRLDLDGLAKDAAAVFSSPMMATAKGVIHPMLLAHVIREQNEFVHQLSNQ